MVKNLQYRRTGFDPWVKKIPWRSEWLPTPVFLSGEFHGQKSPERKMKKIYYAWSKAQYLNIYADKQMILWESLIRKK